MRGAMANRTAKSGLEKRPLTVPTAAEMRLLHVLWDQEEATVEEVVNAHHEKERPNYKTTQTLLRIMEKKGYIVHKSRGRVFVFRPVVSRKVIENLSVQTMISRNFRGSMAGLIINRLESVPVKKKEIETLEAYIQDYRKKHESR
jgi:BlaI family penicillinase repressor